MRVIVGAAAAFCLVTLFEAVTGREDWPLSGYPMYASMPQKSVSRSPLVGVSESGEFELTAPQTAPFSGARLRAIVHRFRGDEPRRQEFLQRVARRYESKRAAMKWPPLRAIRFYTERWRIQPGLVGIDTPSKELDDAIYFPPQPLLARLAAEENGEAPRLEAVKLTGGDVLVDLTKAHCVEHCAESADAHAAGEHALRLLPDPRSPAELSVQFEAPAGLFALYLRMKTSAEFGRDHVDLGLDGKPLAKAARGIGNYVRDLPMLGWVWASLAPGQPPLLLNFGEPGVHTLRLRSKARVDLDELWLSRSVSEIPNDNQVRRL